jgi:hypothetical protein
MNFPMLFLLSDPRNTLRHLKHRIHQDHKEDREEQHQWQKSFKNLCAISIEFVGESLYETYSIKNDGDFNEQGSYFIKTLSSPCSYKKSSDSLSLSNIAPHKIFNPLMLHVPKDFERVVEDTYVYYKHYRSRCVES